MEKEYLPIRKVSYKTVFGWILFGISFLMLGNSIRLCFSSDIWYDELFTMGMAEHSYGEFIRFTARDVHPPLYYAIVKFVIDLCKLIIPSADRVVLAKMVSVMPYFFLLLYALTFIRKRFGTFVAALFFFCMLSMPQMSAYTVEVRMYGWALLFVTAAYFHAYAIVCDENYKGGGGKIHYAALAFYGLAAAYTQYFACVAVIMVYLYLLACFLWRYFRCPDGEKSIKPLKNWLICVFISVIGYLPWLFALLSQITAVRENYWILPLTWRSLGGCVKFLMKPAFTNDVLNTVLAVVIFLIYVSMFALYGCRLWKCRENKTKEMREERTRFFHAFAGCMVLCGLAAFGFAASFLVRPIFVYRYMLPSMGCFWFCFAVCLDALTSRPDMESPAEPGKTVVWRKVIFCASAALIFVTGLRDYRAFLGEEEYKAVCMRETEQAVFDIAKEDIILYNFDQLQAVAGYYTEQESYLWNGRQEKLIEDMFGERGTVENTKQIKKWLDEGRKVWFFGSFNSRENIRDEWAADGIMTRELDSCLLERYWFNIYSVFDSESFSPE